MRVSSGDAGRGPAIDGSTQGSFGRGVWADLVGGGGVVVLIAVTFQPWLSHAIVQHDSPFRLPTLDGVRCPLTGELPNTS